MTITKFGRQECRDVGRQVEDVLQDLAEKLGLDIKTGNGKFDDNSYTVQVICSVKRADGTVMTPDATAFMAALERLEGFEAADLNRKVKFARGRGRIIGYRPRAHRLKILVEFENGKVYSCDTESVRRALAADRALAA